MGRAVAFKHTSSRASCNDIMLNSDRGEFANLNRLQVAALAGNCALIFTAPSIDIRKCFQPEADEFGPWFNVQGLPRLCRRALKLVH